jgi:hypothetical protein
MNEDAFFAVCISSTDVSGEVQFGYGRHVESHSLTFSLRRQYYGQDFGTANRHGWIGHCRTKRACILKRRL